MADLPPPRTRPDDPRLQALGVLFLLTAVVLLLRPWWMPSPPPGLVVEVRGQVAWPGLHVVNPPTLAAAVEAAGGLSDGVPETVLSQGDAVEVTSAGAAIVPMTQPLFAAQAIDVNLASADVLAAVPGLDGKVAEAVVTHREASGPFRSVAELDRVDGVGRGALREARPFVRVEGAALSGARVNVNTADAAALEALPGVGPSLAAKIVADREAHGPFRTVADLDRVSGIGPSMVGKLTDHVKVGEP